MHACVCVCVCVCLIRCSYNMMCVRVFSCLQFFIFIQTRVAVAMRAIRVLTILPPHSKLLFLDMRSTCHYDGKPIPSGEFSLDDHPQVCKREKTGRERVSPVLRRIVDDAVAEAETAVVETSLKLNMRCPKRSCKTFEGREM